VQESQFKKVERHFAQVNKRDGIQASEFELLTAAAFQLFSDSNVEVGVVEVGMGGKLDATNILNNQVVSVISKIARDHQAFLGTTLEEIARHKAGILRPGIPYIVNPNNDENVYKAIEEVAKEVGAGPRIYGDTAELKKDLFADDAWTKFAGPLLPFQRDNAILATLAYREVLRELYPHEDHSVRRIRDSLQGMQGRTISGRYQVLPVPAVFPSSRKILLDGAHNEDAAVALNEYVEEKLRRPAAHAATTSSHKEKKASRESLSPVTWVMAMSEGKEVKSFLKHLLKHGDSLVVTSFGPVDGMPWVKPMDPHAVLKAAEEVCDGITGIVVPEIGPHRALFAAKHLAEGKKPIVMTGSLYLVGDFLRERAARAENEDALGDLALIDRQERNRVGRFLSQAQDFVQEHDSEKKQRKED
jgi:folylpolyglutamate synthase